MENRAMIDGNFRHFYADGNRTSGPGDLRRTRIWVNAVAYSVPSEEIYFELRDWDDNFNPALVGSFDRKTALELGRALIAAAEEKRVVKITDKNGQVHTFANPQKVEEN